MQAIFPLLLLSFLCLITLNDLKHRRVPNMLILGAIGAQSLHLWAASFIDSDSIGLITSAVAALQGFVVALVLFFPLWRLHAVGGGDVKFMAALGYLIGLNGLLSALIIGSVLAGAYALLAFSRQHYGDPINCNRGTYSSQRGIPYAAYTAIGALFGVVWLFFQPQPWLVMLAGY